MDKINLYIFLDMLSFTRKNLINKQGGICSLCNIYLRDNDIPLSRFI